MRTVSVTILPKLERVKLASSRKLKTYFARNYFFAPNTRSPSHSRPDHPQLEQLPPADGESYGGRVFSAVRQPVDENDVITIRRMNQQTRCLYMLNLGFSVKCYRETWLSIGSRQI